MCCAARPAFTSMQLTANFHCGKFARKSAAVRRATAPQVHRRRARGLRGVLRARDATPCTSSRSCWRGCGMWRSCPCLSREAGVKRTHKHSHTSTVRRYGVVGTLRLRAALRQSALMAGCVGWVALQAGCAACRLPHCAAPRRPHPLPRILTRSVVLPTGGPAG